MIKEMLENYMNDKAEIKAIDYKINQIKKEDISIGSSNFFINGDIKAKGYKSSSTENKVIKNVDKVRKLEKQKRELEAKIEMIDSLLNTLNTYNKNLLELRYIKKISLEAIAGQTNRDAPSISRTITNCIKKMDDIYNKLNN